MDAMLAQCHRFERFSFESSCWPALHSTRDQWASPERFLPFFVSRLVGDVFAETKRPTLL